MIVIDLDTRTIVDTLGDVASDGTRPQPRVYDLAALYDEAGDATPDPSKATGATGTCPDTGDGIVVDLSARGTPLVLEAAASSVAIVSGDRP